MSMRGNGAVPAHAAGALARPVEALLFLSTDPLSAAELAEATESSEAQVRDALERLAERYAPANSGLRLRELGGGFTFATDSESEPAARRPFRRTRLPTLLPAP